MKQNYYIIPDELLNAPPPPQFGGVITPTIGKLVASGAVSFALTKALGASVPGAIVMGFGSMLFEAGSGGIPAGWRRYILGLF